MSETTGRG